VVQNGTVIEVPASAVAIGDVVVVYHGETKLGTRLPSPSTAHASTSKQIALGEENVANPLIRNQKIALQAGVSGVGLSEALSDPQIVLVGLQRLGQLALLDQHVADLLLEHRQIALRAGVVEMNLGQL
jgi:hypothetical protein